MEKRSRWDHWRRLWWVALTFVFPGWLSPAAFLYAGLRAHRRRWLAWAAVYAVCTYAFFFAPEDTQIEDTLIPLAIGAWLASIVHAIVIRHEYLERRDILDDPRLASVRRQALERQLSADPTIAAAGVGGKVDLNLASAGEVARLPGFDDAMAERLVHVRAEVGGFASAYEVGHLLDLSAEIVDELKERAVFGEH